MVGEPAPAEPWDQLERAIAAVFDSWQSERAVALPQDRGISGEGGTAVTVQAMVFGNLDERSGTGVLFSRDPTGATESPTASGCRKGRARTSSRARSTRSTSTPWPPRCPTRTRELLEAAHRLDQAAGAAQDIEFTVESGKLWLLQCRKAKVHAGGGPTADVGARAGATVLARGKPACPGFVTGTVVADVDEAEDRALEGEDIILARPTTNPHDVRAMSVVIGILTEIGGATSHAAVVSRELGVACIVGCGTGSLTDLEGQVVTVDANHGEVLEGAVAAADV